MHHVSKTTITSGFLYDRAMPMSRYDVFNNATDTSSYDFALQVYTELYQASYNPTRMSKPSLVNEIIAIQNHNNKIPINTNLLFDDS